MLAAKVQHAQMQYSLLTIFLLLLLLLLLSDTDATAIRELIAASCSPVGIPCRRAFPFDRQRLIVQLQQADSETFSVRLVPSTVATRLYAPSDTGLRFARQCIYEPRPYKPHPADCRSLFHVFRGVPAISALMHCRHELSCNDAQVSGML